MIPYFQDLGARIELQWLHHSYDEEVFPRLAVAELEKLPPAQHIKVEEIVSWTFARGQGLNQPANRSLFGEPPVMVFQAPRFFIEVLFWHSATTEIHEHSFTGAFSVLAGGSVHSHWHFHTHQKVNSRLILGALERASTEVLGPGDTREIYSGSRLIHQLFHLEVPSVTVVVRTYVDRDHLPQYQYLLPGLAVDHEAYDPLRARRLLFLEAMLRGHLGGLQDRVHQLVESGDLETLLAMFSLLTRRKADPALLAQFYEHAERLYGEPIQIFREACDWERRTRIITSLRGKVSDPQARYLLALLMLFPDRTAILEVVRKQHPDVDPLTTIEEAVERMSGKEIIGFEFNQTNRVLFRGLLEGLDTDALLERLTCELHGQAVAENRDRLVDHVRSLARSEVFLPLLSDSPLRRQALSA
ncbi:MAG: hypothetical protein U0002_17295 [Thermoanaerobaculia bacterium]